MVKVENLCEKCVNASTCNEDNLEKAFEYGFECFSHVDEKKRIAVDPILRDAKFICPDCGKELDYYINIEEQFIAPLDVCCVSCGKSINTEFITKCKVDFDENALKWIPVYVGGK